MAQGVVVTSNGEEEKEGTGLIDVELPTLKEYLTEEDLLMVYSKLKANGFKEITTLLHMNESELSELCVALQLSLMETLKFKPSIRKLKTLYAQEQKQQNDKEIKIIKTKICKSFDDIITKLNSRKIQLIEELEQTYINKTNKHIFNIEYYPCNKYPLIQSINTFGKIQTVSDIVTEPSIAAKINRKNSLIEVDINNENKDNIKSIEIYYKNKNQSENEEKLDDSIDDWKLIKNDPIITDIQPLSQYDIRARYMTIDSVWSELSKTITIDIQFECVWDEQKHQNNKYISFIADDELLFNKRCSTTTVLCNNIFKKETFSMVKFQFVVREFCQPSQFGFISAEKSMNETMKGYWNYKSIAYNKYAFVLGAMDDTNYIHRYKNGKDTDSTFFSNAGISIPLTIKKGNRFTFDIDFDALTCNVFVNANQNSIWVANKKNVATWCDIPSKIIPLYSHCRGTKLIEKSSRVQIKLLDYELR